MKGEIAMNVTNVSTTHYQQNGDHIVGMVLDPYEMEQNDPFLFLAHDDFVEGTFGPHPHRGIETVTYVVSGTVEHFDTANGPGTIHEGDVQWMTAGHGVLHSEEPAKGTRAQVLQLWVNLPADEKMRESNYQTLLARDMPVVSIGASTIRLFAGALGADEAPTETIQPVHFFEVRVPAGETVTIPTPSDWKTFAAVLEGSGTFGTNERPATARQAVHFDGKGTSVTITATDDLLVLLYAGKPLGQPIAARGPFVMTTDEELQRAFQDYRNGYFHTLEKKED